MYLIGDASLEERQHAADCAACQTKIAKLATSLSHFRGAVRNWSDRTSAKDLVAEMRWTVIPASDHLERMLLPVALDTPWYRSLWSGIHDAFKPLPPLDVTSKPVLVSSIWNQYGPQKKSWLMSVAFQSAAILLLFTAASNRTVQQKVAHFIPLIAPNLAEYEPAPAHVRDTMAGRRWRRRSLAAACLEGPTSEGRVEAVHSADGGGSKYGP